MSGGSIPSVPTMWVWSNSKTSVFQTDNEGAIPSIHSKYRQMSQGGELVSKTDCGGFDSLLSMPKLKKCCMSGWGRSGLENH